MCRHKEAWLRNQDNFGKEIAENVANKSRQVMSPAGLRLCIVKVLSGAGDVGCDLFLNLSLSQCPCSYYF